MKRTLVLLLILSLSLSCKDEVSISFHEESIETSDVTEIAINYPKAKENNDVSNRINLTLQKFIISQINLSDNASEETTIDDAVLQFNSAYKDFKNNFEESSQKWEAFIDGEVTFQSSKLICIAMNSYLDTGGAHGNTTIKFFNFNAQSGELYSTSDLITEIDAISETIAAYLKEELKSKAEDQMEDYFFGKGFQLPESLGFSDEGLIVLYNPYEIASYSQGIIEFTIPYDDINAYINIH